MVWVAALLLALCGEARAQLVSPGELSRAHASLDGSSQCDACHGSHARVEAARCLSCHEALAGRLKARRGYHAGLGNRCGKCHQEHQGRGFDIIRWPGPIDRFPHARTGFRLAGKHVGPECRDCHKPEYQRDARVRRFDAARRRKTWLGLSASQCQSCHVDAHDGELGDRCQKCHDDRSFDKTTAGFDHDQTKFRLTGAHAKVECKECHKRPATRDARGNPKRRFDVPGFQRCDACHEDPHRGAMTPSRAHLGLTCESCHDDSEWARIHYPRAKHSPRRMPLIGGHERLACTKCHGAKAARTPRPACDSCHRDVHGGKFGAACKSCHGFTNWTARAERAAPSMRDANAVERAERLGIGKRELARVAFHDRTKYPLTGRHVTVACDKCHPKRRARGYKRFVGLSYGSCADCHQDQHRGQLARDQQPAPRCDRCHTTDGWPLVRYGVTDHDQARFALKGAHRATPCDACHPKSRPPAERFTYPRRACADCHDDPHRGQFGAAGCDSCHAATGFVPARFDHDATRLPLTGAHATTACRACHPEGSGQVVRYRGVDPSCATCHRDRHEGQFARPPARPCSDCHQTDRFTIAHFDHDAATRYPLTGAHTRAACADCHHPVTLADGRRIALYRLKATDCTACHREQHRPSRRGRRTVFGNAGATALDDCRRCHRTDGWRQLTRPADFDHGAVGYPLRGGHRGATCVDCHRAARPVSRACDSCHADHHGGRMGNACAECHTPDSWQPSEMLARHARTRLPLTGGHALADCTSCHPRARGQQFVAVPVDCVACHIDDYHAPTTHPKHAEQGYGLACEQCHRPAGWSPAFFAHTSFPLEGKHRTAACNACHDRNPVPRDCVGCHDGDRPTGTSPDHQAPGFPVDCGQCHNPSGWVPAEFPDHDALFPISSGRHSGYDCADCHPDSTDLAVFTCTTSTCHPRTETDEHHHEVGGYSYQDHACYNCHPRGVNED